MNFRNGSGSGGSCHVETSEQSLVTAATLKTASKHFKWCSAAVLQTLQTRAIANFSSFRCGHISSRRRLAWGHCLVHPFSKSEKPFYLAVWEGINKQSTTCCQLKWALSCSSSHWASCNASCIAVVVGGRWWQCTSTTALNGQCIAHSHRWFNLRWTACFGRLGESRKPIQVFISANFNIFGVICKHGKHNSRCPETSSHDAFSINWFFALFNWFSTMSNAENWQIKSNQGTFILSMST